MIEILVPVFNAYEDLAACLDSILAHTDQSHPIAVLDDASTDERIGAHVGSLAARHSQIRYVRSPRNQGLVSNVNAALSHNLNDVLLLNSDTLVTPGWLEAITRCRDSSLTIGIVCPLSNNATILSVPEFNVDNPLPTGIDANDMAELVAACSTRAYPRIPTAVGFCMLITRAAISRLGRFDPAFGLGYSEECDYSMRAWRAGIEVACCDDAFVFHRGHASFGNDGTINATRARNAALLIQRWPGYESAVRRFCAENPLRELQEALSVRLICRSDPTTAAKPHVLQIAHRFETNGGVEHHVHDMVDGLGGELRFSVMHPLRQSQRWTDFSRLEYSRQLQVIRWHALAGNQGESVLGFSTELHSEQCKTNLSRFFAGSDIRIVHVHHFANWRTFEIPRIAKQHGKQVVVSLHDYHLLCPNYNLLLPSLQRCHQPHMDLDRELCRQCHVSTMRTSSLVAESTPLREYSERRRTLVRDALEVSDAIIAPSEFVRAAFLRSFGPDIARRVRVIEHGVPSAGKATHVHNDTRLRVACLGNLNLVKGAKLLLDTAALLRSTAVSFTIHGSAELALTPALAAFGILADGSYSRPEICDRLANFDAVLILSIWDETFCLALSEAQAAGVPVIAPRVGGITERIRDGENGFLYKMGDAVELSALLKNFSNDRRALNVVRGHLERWSPKSLTAMLEDYRDLYFELLLSPELKMSAPLAASDSPSGPPTFVNEFCFPTNPNVLGSPTDGDWFAWRRKSCVSTCAASGPNHISEARRIAVHWLILVDASNHAWIERSIGSVRACAGFESKITMVTGACDIPPNSPAAQGDLRVFASQKQLDAYIQEFAVDQSKWIALLPCGDTVSADLAHGLCALVDLEPQLDYIYCDENRTSIDDLHYAPFFKPRLDRQWAMSAPYSGRFAFCRTARLRCIALPLEWLSLAAYAALTAIILDGGDRSVGHLAGIHHHALDIPGNRIGDWIEDAALILHDRFSERGSAYRIDLDPRRGYFRASPVFWQKPSISIIVASADVKSLKLCLRAISVHTDYPNVEVIAVLTGTQDAHVVRQMTEGFPTPLTIISISDEVQQAAALQVASLHARNEILVLLSDTTHPAGASWLDEIAFSMVEPDVGIVGGRVLAPWLGLEFGGLYLGCGNGGIARYAYEFPLNQFPTDIAPREFSALPGDYLCIRAALLQELHGLDSVRHGLEYWSIDICLKAREAGYRVCWTPRLVMLSVGVCSILAATPAERRELLRVGERDALYLKWHSQLSVDPAHSPCLAVGPTAASTPDIYSELALKILAPNRGRPPGLMVFPFDEWGSGQYRARLPARAMQAAGAARVRIMGNHHSGVAATPPELWRFGARSLLLHNFLHDYQLDALTQFRRHGGSHLVFGMDDLLIDIPEYNPYHRTIYPDIERRVATALALCDRLIVTTDALANRYAPLIKDIRVLPNYLDAQHWRTMQSVRSKDAHGRLRVGWAGAKQHLGDLEILTEVVKCTCAKVDWIFFGLCPPAISPYASEIHDMVCFERYPQRLADLALDVAVAPLADNAFNRAKSNLRLLEYGLLGMPVICSDTEPYRGAPVIRVSNDPAQWVDAVMYYSEHKERAELDGEALRAWVRSRWILQDHTREWSDALFLT